MGRYSYDMIGSIDPDNDWRHEPGPEDDGEDEPTPTAPKQKLRVRFTDFLATSYRGKDLTLALEGGWWVCVIDDLPHSAHNAVKALKGWFEIWSEVKR